MSQQMERAKRMEGEVWMVSFWNKKRKRACAGEGKRGAQRKRSHLRPHAGWKGNSPAGNSWTPTTSAQTGAMVAHKIPANTPNRL